MPVCDVAGCENYSCFTFGDKRLCSEHYSEYKEADKPLVFTSDTKVEDRVVEFYSKLKAEGLPSELVERLTLMFFKQMLDHFIPTNIVRDLR